MSRRDPLRTAYAAWVAAPVGNTALRAWRAMAKRARDVGFPVRDVESLILRLRKRYPDVQDPRQ